MLLAWMTIALCLGQMPADLDLTPAEAGDLVPEDDYVFPRMAKLFHQKEVEDRRKSMRDPGPDSTDFPNSPYTLPAGRFYVELTPFTWTGQTTSSPASYSFQMLYRYGVTDNWEFRLYTNGLQVDMAGQGKSQAVGFSPVVFDMKIHLQDEVKEWFLPALGLEVQIQTEFGSARLSDGVQPNMNLLATHSLGEKWAFNWNVGIEGGLGEENAIYYQTAYQWSIVRELPKNISLYVHGYMNDAALPRFGVPGVDTGNALVVGGGFQWEIFERFSFWGSANAGLNRTAPDTLFYMGSAFAF